MQTTIRVSAIFLLAIICVCYLGYTGHCIEKSQNVYYQSGKLKEEGKLKDGKREGVHRVYYESGKLKQEGNFKDGGREGIHKLYYENGTLAREGNFNMADFYQKRVTTEMERKLNAQLIALFAIIRSYFLCV